MENSKIFDPRNFPTSKSEAASYGQDEVVKLAQYIGGWRSSEMTEIQTEWADLVKQIMEDPEFYVVKEAEPNFFWLFYLDNVAINFPPKIKEVLEFTLSLAASSSDAERAFSVMAKIKTKERNRMGHELLNALMFFKINSASSIEEFPALTYSIKWKEAGHMLVDDENAPAKRKSLADFEADDEYNESRNRKILSGKSSLW